LLGPSLAAGVAMGYMYVLPVLQMTLRFHIMNPMGRVAVAAASLQRLSTAATSLQCTHGLNAPAAWYWLRPVPADEGWRQA